MKLKDIFFLLGLKPNPREYGFTVRSFELAREGRIDYAQWLHPSETPKEMTQAAVDELRTFLSPGDVAIDIGAHTGDTAIPMALAVGPAGCVIALEPNRYVFPVLRKNSELNRVKTNIVPLMLAAAARDGDMVFEYSDSGYCNGGLHEGMSKWTHGHAFELKVTGRDLDNLMRTEFGELLPRIRYIKVDAEGYDCTIIKAIGRIISECRPFIKAEVYKKTGNSERAELFNTIRNHGYVIHKVESDTRFRGEIINTGNLMKWRHYDIFCVPEK